MPFGAAYLLLLALYSPTFHVLLLGQHSPFLPLANSQLRSRCTGHDPDKWCEFNRRYFAELDGKPEIWQPLLEAARRGKTTLLFSTRELERNNAVTLRAYLEKKLKYGG